jgi:6-phosphofructokinase 1
MKDIAVLCSGGDVSGMNPAIKQFVEYSFKKGLTPYLVYDGYEGLIDNVIEKATYTRVTGIINKGGTIIGSSRSKRFMTPEGRAKAKANLDAHDIKMIVILGGDGSFRGMDVFYKEHGVPCCGIPSTIDNDTAGTDYSLGVDTALNMIRSAIDSIRDTASSFKRAFVIETMGRDCGFLALVSALTSGAEMCLIPELPYDLSKAVDTYKSQIAAGRRYIIAIVSEGIEQDSSEIVEWFEKEVGIEARLTLLGHVQRGGNPTIHDRLMAYRFMTYAIDGLLAGHTQSVVCYTKSHFHYRDVDYIASHKYEIEPELLKLTENICNITR